MLIFTVNDGAVVSFWVDYLKDRMRVKSADQIKTNAEALDPENFTKFAADVEGELAKACGMELVADGPLKVLGRHRSKRFACIVENGKVQWVDVSEEADDPAGDADPSKTMPDAVLKHLL